MMVLRSSKYIRVVALISLCVVTFAAPSPATRTDVLAGIGTRASFIKTIESSNPLLLSSFNSPGNFRFIYPLTTNPPDPMANFDADLLPYLKVSVCRIDGSGCVPVASFTSQGSMSTQLRIESKPKDGSYYIVNWDTSGARLINTATYRVGVEAAGIALGSIDLPPAVYNPWGRTWPIKFIVENDPALRIQVLAASGSSIWEIADELRTELGLCDDELRQLLLANYPDADAEQVDEVVNGVCQEVVLQPNTKIVDKETRDALASYDMSTGRMIFAGDTALLKSLQINDVIVSRQSPAAPYGYLRKVISIRKGKGIYTLETVQAKFTEAIQVGTLQVSGPLEPGDTANVSGLYKLPSSNIVNSLGGTIDVGNQIPFTRHIDEIINLDGGDDEIGGTGTIRVVGDIEIRAGYNIGAGIELCTTPPFACADRVEAWMGFVHKSNLRVIGNFQGHLRKEFSYPIPMSPIFFMIGPLPVWLVPEVNVIVGFYGTAHVNFEFATEVQSNVKPYVKWTDDVGWWKDISTIEPLSHTFFDAKFDGDARLEGYAKLDAALLLYGAIGPSMDGSLGIIGEAKTGGNPFWKISGHVKAGIGLRSAITDLFDIDAHEDFLDETFELERSENQKPQCTHVTDTIKPNITVPITLGPNSGGFFGYFNCVDPEGKTVNYTAKSSNPDDGVGGVIPLRYAFDSGGPRTVTITAVDGDGGIETFDLLLEVVNTPPIIIIATATTTVQKGVQYFITAAAYDWEAQEYVTCVGPAGQIIMSVSGPDVLQQNTDVFTCTAVVVFGEEGPRNIKVDAYDRNNGHSERTVTVNVTAPPDNPAPTIDLNSFLITAAEGPDNPFVCPTGLNCVIPFGADLSSTGNYRAPLTMSLVASDPNNEPLTIKWFCGDVPATVSGGGTIGCPVETVGGDPFIVRATVSDGTTTVYSEVRHFFAAFGPR